MVEKQRSSTATKRGTPVKSWLGLDKSPEIIIACKNMMVSPRVIALFVQGNLISDRELLRKRQNT